jgi:hypothetical protein
MTGREILQKVGTDALRNNFYEDVWVNATFVKYNLSVDNLIVTDLRFPNELEKVKELKGVVFKVTRDNNPFNNQKTHNFHASEVGLSSYILPEIKNNSSLEDLKCSLKCFLDPRLQTT